MRAASISVYHNAPSGPAAMRVGALPGEYDAGGERQERTADDAGVTI
jgi:hypothetical protein